MCTKKDKETYKIMSSSGFGFNQQGCQRYAFVALWKVLVRLFFGAVRSVASVILYLARVLTFSIKPVFKTEVGGISLVAE